MCLWKNKTKRKGHSKINKKIKRNIYKWITRHPKIVKLSISNDCLKGIFDNQTEPKMVPKQLPQVSVRELYNSLVSDTNYGGLKEASYGENNINISDSTLLMLLPTQLKQISSQYKVMCGCECCISSKSINSLWISWRDIYLKNPQMKVKILKSEGLVKK